jgi:hypothetical protein
MNVLVLGARIIQDAPDVLRAVCDRSEATATSDSRWPLISPMTRRVRSRRRAACGRPWAGNVMIKAPATTEGLPAVRTLPDEGIGSDVAAGLAALDAAIGRALS